MKSVWKAVLFFGITSQLVAAEKPDVQTIVNKANNTATSAISQLKDSNENSCGTYASL